MKPINPNLLCCSRLTVLVVLAGWSVGWLADGVAVLGAQDAAKAAEAVDAAKKQADDDAEKSLPAGHSNHGEAFNEGPRQKAYLMGGTGDVSFPATCAKPIVQKFIDQGVGQLHGFWFFEAERSFRQAAAIDPECAPKHIDTEKASPGGRWVWGGEAVVHLSIIEV